MNSGVARSEIDDWNAYKLELEERIGTDSRLISRIVEIAKRDPKRVVFAEADDPVILQAAQMVKDEGIAVPILLGKKDKIHQLIEENELDLSGAIIINPQEEKEKVEEYSEIYLQKRQRKGINRKMAKKNMQSRNFFGSMMVELGEADALISGLSNDYPKTILPALQIIGVEPGVNKVAGLYIMSTDKGNFFFADTSVNLNPSAEELVEIIGLTSRVVRFFDHEPHIAALSYSNFGSAKGETPKKMAKAVEMAKERWPELIIDGDMQANVAVQKDLLNEHYPFSDLTATGANTLIFPNLDAGNIAYKLLMELGGAEAIGPILMGMNKTVHVLQQGTSARGVFNMVAIAVVDAQNVNDRKPL